MHIQGRSCSSVFCLLRFCFALAIVGGVSATPILTFDPNSGLTGVNQNQTVGWRFDVRNAITIIGLGWYDEDGNGLATNHMVGLWSPGGALLASTLVPSGLAAPLDGQFRTNFIMPIALPPGIGYVIGGQNSRANAEHIFGEVVQEVNGSVSYLGPLFSTADSGFIMPSHSTLISNGIYGPSFSIPTPEPSSASLLGITLMVVATVSLPKLYTRTKRNRHGTGV